MLVNVLHLLESAKHVLLLPSERGQGALKISTLSKGNLKDCSWVHEMITRALLIFKLAFTNESYHQCIGMVSEVFWYCEKKERQA